MQLLYSKIMKDGKRGYKLPGPSFVEYIYNNNPIILCQITRKNNTHTSFVLPTTFIKLFYHSSSFSLERLFDNCDEYKKSQKKPCLKKQKQL